MGIPEEMLIASYQELQESKAMNAVRRILDDPNKSIEDARKVGEAFKPIMPSKRAIKVLGPMEKIALQVAKGEITPEEAIAAAVAYFQSVKDAL